MEKFFPLWLVDVLQVSIFNQTLNQWALAVGVFLGILVVVKLFRRFILKRFEIYAKHTPNKWDDALAKIVRHISKLFYVLLALYLTTEFYLDLLPAIEKLVRALFIISLAYELIKISQSVIYYGLGNSKIGRNKTSLQGAKLVANIALWAIGILMVLDNLGFDVSALAASLGIGGIAIALAAQNILGDLFSSFSIYFDKPFQVGDFVVLDLHEGTVKRIGLKTTRIEALSGEEIVVSNAELTSSRIRNYKKMKRRRMESLFGVVYGTAPEKLEMIPEIFKQIVEEISDCTFDRAHFRSFGASSLDFQCIYFIEDGDKKKSMDIQQKVNLGLCREFAREGIEMAFPTQTVYVKN